MPELDQAPSSVPHNPEKDVQAASLHPVSGAMPKEISTMIVLPYTSEEEEKEGRRLAKMPQLQCAQDLLQQQLEGMKAALKAELRERQKEVKVHFSLQPCPISGACKCRLCNRQVRSETRLQANL